MIDSPSKSWPDYVDGTRLSRVIRVIAFPRFIRVIRVHVVPRLIRVIRVIVVPR